MTAVVFDMDGTLTDTEHIWDVVRRGLADAEGLPWPEEASRAMMGMATQEWSAYLSDVVGLSGTAQDAAKKTIDGMAASYALGLDLLPGAVEAVQRMHSRWPLGLASSSPRVLIDEAVAAMGLTDLFVTTLSTEEVNGAGKPAPDVYLEVCRRIGVEPGSAVAIEDAHNGILSAHAAGLKVIAIPPHFNPPPASTLALADVVLDSLDDLTTDLVAGLLGAA
ncbi:MAG TPA: HAD family phosphatase [Propionicimonas sp.]|uniref:HAD family hydrolase n=1 Tax=Propionicimonas sp. TaxID=1955623 RepID=UPI002F40F39C